MSSSMAMAMAAEATTAEAVTLVSDAAAPLTAALSAADGGPDGNDSSAVIAMQKKFRSPVNLKPKALILRRITRYYSYVWAVD